MKRPHRAARHTGTEGPGRRGPADEAGGVHAAPLPRQSAVPAADTTLPNSAVQAAPRCPCSREGTDLDDRPPF